MVTLGRISLQHGLAHRNQLHSFEGGSWQRTSQTVKVCDRWDISLLFRRITGRTRCYTRWVAVLLGSCSEPHEAIWGQKRARRSFSGRGHRLFEVTTLQTKVFGYETEWEAGTTVLWPIPDFGSYKLLLPPTAKINDVHPVFHISQLKRVVGSSRVTTDLQLSSDFVMEVEPELVMDRVT